MGNSQGLSSRSTATEVASHANADLRGKYAIVTGANTGIGKVTARVLAERGAHVVITCRDQAKIDATVNDIKAAAGQQADISGIPLELSSLKSVKDFAKAYLAKNIPLHLLILNAGIMAAPLSYTEDGFESQFAVNHLGHFLLTNLLLDLVKKSAPARIVSVSSTAHNLGSIHWDDFKGEKSYIAWERYGQSKLANVLMVKELQRRLDEEGVDIVVNAVHPGTVRTDLGRHSLAWTVVCALFGWAFLKDVEQGASTTIYAAVHPDTAHSKAQYFADNAIGYPNAASQNMESAKRLWDVSVDMVKLEEALKDAQ